MKRSFCVTTEALDIAPDDSVRVSLDSLISSSMLQIRLLEVYVYCKVTK